MMAFLNLREGGGFAWKARNTNFRGVRHWCAELLRASRGATTMAFLIATQLLDSELSRSQQRRKHYLIATASGVLRAASNSPIGRLAFPGARGSRITGLESRSTRGASRFMRHYPNQSLAKHNRKPMQLIENKHQRSKSIASFCRVFRGSKGAQLKLAATNSTAQSTSPACPSGKQAAATKSKEGAH